MSIRQFNSKEVMEVSVGTTVATREMNGYDDSDFYATYMNANGDAVEVQYCTTRGGSNGCAFVDAPDEMMELYYEYLRSKQAAAKRWCDVQSKLKARDMRRKTGLKPAQFNKLVNCYGLPKVGAFSDPLKDQKIFRVSEELRKLNNNSHRSDFRKSLATQIRDWAMDSDSQYDKPLSYKQDAYI